MARPPTQYRPASHRAEVVNKPRRLGTAYHPADTGTGITVPPRHQWVGVAHSLNSPRMPVPGGHTYPATQEEGWGAG